MGNLLGGELQPGKQLRRRRHLLAALRTQPAHEPLRQGSKQGATEEASRNATAQNPGHSLGRVSSLEAHDHELAFAGEPHKLSHEILVTGIAGDDRLGIFPE